MKLINWSMLMEKRDYIVLDLAGCGYLGDLHGRLKKAFDFTTILRYFAPEGMINPGVWSTI